MIEFNGDFAERMIEAFLSAYPKRYELERFVLTKCNKHLDKIIGVGPGQEQVVYEFLKWAEADGKLEHTIQAAFADRPKNLLIKTLHENLFPTATTNPPVPVGAAPGMTDIYDYCLFNNGEVFCNREDFRVHLKEMEQTQAKRTLIVAGESGMGKSYSQEMLQHSAKAKGHQYLWVELQEHLGPNDGAGSLAEYLVRRINPKAAHDPTPVLGSDSPDRHLYSNLMSWTLGWLGQNVATTWWIVIDSFDNTLVSRQIYHFLTFLAEEIEVGMPNYRLVLLGYDDPIPAKLIHRARYEEITAIKKSHVESFYVWFFESKNQPLDMVSIGRLTDEAFNEYAAAGIKNKLRLGQLNQRLKHTIANL